jgi:hypothetical protein
MQGSSETMPEALPTWIGDIAPVPIIVGLVWAFYWLVSSGRLVPRSTVDLIIAANDKIQSQNERTIDSQERQIVALLDVNETTKHVLESIQEASSRGVHDARR